MPPRGREKKSFPPPCAALPVAKRIHKLLGGVYSITTRVPWYVHVYEKATNPVSRMCKKARLCPITHPPSRRGEGEAQSNHTAPSANCAMFCRSCCNSVRNFAIMYNCVCIGARSTARRILIVAAFFARSLMSQCYHLADQLPRLGAQPATFLHHERHGPCQCTSSCLPRPPGSPPRPGSCASCLQRRTRPTSRLRLPRRLPTSGPSPRQ